MLIRIFTVLVLLTAGCDSGEDGGGVVDCQPVDGVRDPDIRESGAGPIAAWTELGNNNWAEEDVIDFTSCPSVTPGGTCTFTGQVQDFAEDRFLQELAGTTVRLYVNDRIDDINAPCEQVGSGATDVVCWEDQADPDGVVNIPGITCGQKFAVWTYKESPIVPVTKRAVEFGRFIETSSGTQRVITISVGTYNLIPDIIGFPPDPTLGVIAGQVRDCADKGVNNVTAHVEAGTVTEPTGNFCGDAPINRVGTFYFRQNDEGDTLPNRDQTVTNFDGIWAFANVPPGQVTVFGKGRRTAGGPYEVLGSIQMTSLPDTIAIGDIIVTAP